ncbi:MAG: STAS domain-containing protein [bacterium]|nr:STAS domain-containing protein [bacterium]
MFNILSSKSDTLILQLTSDLKMENAPEFYETFQEVLVGDHQRVVVDFRRIRFVDSSGVGMLLKCAHQLRQREGSFYIYGLSKSLLSVFKLAGLLKIFQLLDDDQTRADFPELLDENLA